MDIGDRLEKPVDPEVYSEYANWCNARGNATIEDKGEYYEVVAITIDVEKDALERERMTLQAWLTDHDYIGTKIATGRATVEEYASEIQTMREYAQRIEEIREILGGNS